MKKYLSVLFIALAAIFNAVMDTLWTHFSVSIFKGLNSKWWNPNESWQYVNNFLGIVRLDAWHLAKYGMLFSIAGAVITFESFALVGKRWVEFLVICVTWSAFFELFYSFIL